jgi:hypothetical protein
MHPDRERRFACADDFAEALLPFISEQSSHKGQRLQSKASEAKRGKGRRNALFCAGLGIAAAASLAMVPSRKASVSTAPVASFRAAVLASATVPTSPVLASASSLPAAAPVVIADLPASRPASPSATRPFRARATAPSTTTAAPREAEPPVRGENDAPILDVP